MFGFLNIYKPSGITSFTVISALRKVLRIKQIGHLGTLDPLAEGVLPVAIGKATRILEYLKDDKTYIATMLLGKISDTYDVEGNVEEFSNKKVLEEEFFAILEKFKGEIEQIPPAFSAVHYKGKRLYELARKGEIPNDIPKRKVFIEKIELLDFNYNQQEAKILVKCSKGTYIRTIINDIGIILKTGAVMSNLERIAAGDFFKETSLNLNDVKNIDIAKKYLINPLNVLNNKKKILTENEYLKVKNGQYLLTKNNKYLLNEKILLVYKDKLIAISEYDGTKIIMNKVFI